MSQPQQDRWMQKLQAGLADAHPALPNKRRPTMHPARSLAIGTYLRIREALIRLAVWLREPALVRDLEAYRVKRHNETLDALEGLSPGARAAAEAGIALANRAARR